MRKFLASVLLPLLAGCLTSSVPDVSQWMLSYQPPHESAAPAKYGVARVAHVSVRAPYRVKSVVVLRADGSFALDRYNEYVAEPAQLLRGAVSDALVESRLFSSVVSSTSLARSAVSVEVEVSTLALDCRGGDAASRKAVAALVLRLVDANGAILKAARGEGSASAEKPDFGAALSKAFSLALGQALDQID